MVVRSEVYAKPGELIQGALPGNQRFLLSNVSSRIFKNTTEVGIGSMPQKDQLSYKSLKAIDLFWSTITDKGNSTDISKLYFKQEGNIPIGKGLSSSSADVLGLLKALTVFYNTGYDHKQLYDLAAAIEPTDPCLHTGNLIFDQDSGNIRKELSTLPYHLIYFDSNEKEEVDTIALSKTVCYSDKDQQLYEHLCEKIELAAKDKDYEIFNWCLNKSAALNQFFLPKRKFEILQNFSIENKTGLFVAHSGTYMGLAIEPLRFENVKTKAIALIEKNWNTPIYIE